MYTQSEQKPKKRIIFFRILLIPFLIAAIFGIFKGIYISYQEGFSNTQGINILTYSFFTVADVGLLYALGLHRWKQWVFYVLVGISFFSIIVSSLALGTSMILGNAVPAMNILSDIVILLISVIVVYYLWAYKAFFGE